MRLAFGFNHAEAQRAFRAAQKLDPACALCCWGEALILGPNINVPMNPEANAPALAALAKAVALKDKATPRERALIEALEKRYAADPKAERAPLDAAYADAMKDVAARFPADTTIATLAAEAAMDTQPWDYWEAGGVKPKGRGAYIVDTLESVLKRHPGHPGAIHLYIHAVEASTKPERALPHANRLAALMPGAGHIVHMPAHIYYRVGMYRESLAINQRAIAVDERYFGTSPSDPLYKSAYYPHNIHFVMVSAQVGGDGKLAVEAARKLDAAIPVDVVKAFPIMQPIKACAVHDARASSPIPTRSSRCPRRGEDLALVRTMYHYARAVAYAGKKDAAAAQREIDAIARLEATTRLQAVRRVEPAGEGDHADGAPCRHRPARRRAGRPREGRVRVRGGDLRAGHAAVHRAAVLVLPGAAVARRRAAAPGQARRRREGVPRIARCARATTAGRSPGSPRCTSTRAMRRPRRPRARRTRRPGPAPRGPDLARLYGGTIDDACDGRSARSLARSRLPAPAEPAKGTVALGTRSATIQHAWLVVGPDAVDPKKTIRRVVFSVDRHRREAQGLREDVVHATAASTTG